MKRLSDYKGEEALDLWADLLEPLTKIINDKKLISEARKKSRLLIAKDVISLHPKETSEILLRIDPTPLDGMNIITRVVAIITDVGENEDVKPFFASAVQEDRMNEESSGSVMENTKVAEK